MYLAQAFGQCCESKNIRPGVGLLGLVTVIVVMVFSTSVLAAQPERFAEGRILVMPKTGVSDFAFKNALKRAGGMAERRIAHLNVHVVRVPPRAEQAIAKALARNPHIKFAEPDMLVELEEVIPNDPKFGSAWHLPKIEAPAAWDMTRGAGVTVAILDTGVDAAHPDLSSQLVSGWNAASNNFNTSDVNGHGTAVAGTVAAVSDNALGVASVAWSARIMPVRVTNRSDGGAYWSSIANALIWAANHGAKVANISYGVTNSAVVTSAAQYMRSKGGVVVVAAGNSGSDLGYADNPYIISVSATSSSDSKTSWSSFGNYVDVAAPGAGIWSTTRGGGYASVSGTSFASPVTVGVVALMMSVNPALTPADIEQLLESHSDDLGAMGWDKSYGHGRVNAARAVAAALGNTTAQDLIAPQVDILSPTGGTVVGAVMVNISASDNEGVERVDLYANGQLLLRDVVAPFGFTVDTTLLSEGWNSLVAYAYDAAGNEGRSVPVQVMVDNVPETTDTIPPTVVISKPTDGSKVRRGVRIRASAQDNVAIASMWLSIDGVQRKLSSKSYLSFYWNSRSASNGAHVIELVAEDVAGNRRSVSVKVVVAN